MYKIQYMLAIGVLVSFGSLWTSSAAPSDLSTLSNILESMDRLLQQAITKVQELMKFGSSSNVGPIDCTQIFREGHTKSGVYRIWPLNWETYGSFNVYCDMVNDGGGWTVIQRRGKFSQPKDYFYRNWTDYLMGFGNINQEFWLGNDRIFSLTNQGNYTLRINMKDKEGEKRFASYQEFWIESERQLYTLHVSGYSGDNGDSFSNFNGMKFSTKDKDNDIWVNSCAEAYKGGWWYNKCHLSNLNGLNLDGNHTTYADGINWHTWKGYHYSLPEVHMKIKRL